MIPMIALFSKRDQTLSTTGETNPGLYKARNGRQKKALRLRAGLF